MDALQVDVVIVTFDSSQLARGYLEDTGVPWTLLLDKERSLYAAYDMLKASVWDVWGPRSVVAYLQALWSGERLSKGGRDAHQRGGNILIDPDGIVRLHHIGRGPADRPPVETLIEVVEAH